MAPSRHSRLEALGSRPLAAIRRPLAPARYTRLTRFALWALAAIVVTGAAVRLTGSGLGCSDWPTCSEDRFVADLEYHALVEFVNRLFTGVVALAVIGAVAGAWRRRPFRRDLALLSLGLVVGVLAQVGLGALLVLSELDPRFTMGHFLLSMVLLWNASVLDVRARSDLVARGDRSDVVASGARSDTAMPWDTGPDRTPSRGRSDTATRVLLWSILVVGAAVLVAGTLVTGSGPHAGDSHAERLPFLVREVTRIHSIVALVLLGLVALAWWRLRDGDRASQRRLGRVAVLLMIQGILGYTQYFTGVPAILVGVHVALASIVWIEIVKAVHGRAAGASSCVQGEAWSRARRSTESLPAAALS